MFQSRLFNKLTLFVDGIKTDHNSPAQLKANINLAIPEVDLEMGPKLRIKSLQLNLKHFFLKTKNR